MEGITLFALIIAAAGCSKEESTPVTPPTQTSFANAVQPILAVKCVGCHNPSGPPAAFSSLDLSAATAYTKLVNVASKQQSSRMLVRPSMPDSSYLIMKVSMAPPPVGARMPKDASPLDAASIEVIRKWISEGAPNN